MILTVRHITTYRYERPVARAVQSLRLFPSVHAGQRVIDWRVEVMGGVRGGSFRDGAGDRVEGWTLAGPVDALRIEVEGQVETSDQSGVLRGYREVISPEVYLQATPRIAADDALAALAHEAGGATADPLERAHRLAAAVAGAIAYRPGSTHAHTTAAEALAQGEGVCQDHTHALIAMAQFRGVPARYVSGYLLADAQGREHEAAHAWAEIHVESLGWVGFDASNATCPDGRYIRLASGRDAADAAPVRGIAEGGSSGAESLDVTVAVEAAQQ